MIRTFVCVLVFLLVIVGCSSEKNTVTSKAFHNVTSHYNGYYYALEEITKIEQTIYKSHTDDYNHILKIFPTFDSTLAKGYDKEIQEAVKMASIAIQRHPNSKWVDDAYILVGKARMYSLDWGNAIQTFKFVNTKSKDPEARHAAIIQLIRTFTEHQEYNNAQAAIDFLEKEELNKKNQKDFFLEKAYYYQIQRDYDKMVRNLTGSDNLLKKKDRKGRLYFIIGQVYQELGFESEAFNYYKKCISTNPEYEVDFYARLYMAQVTEVTRNRSVNAVRKSFRKILKDRKNKDFHDKIYYEMGMFELKQKDIKQAIEDFNLSLRAGTNKLIDGEAYLRLGEIFYDTLRNYEQSQAYYDSAIQALPRTYEGYAQIKARQEVLNEFVKNLKTIQWQDSLLAMAALDSATLRNRIDSAFTAKSKLAEKTAGKKKKKSNRVEIASNSSNIFATGSEGEELQDDITWYYGNPSAMAIGQTEFTRIWGSIALEDNWRRSLRGTPTNVVLAPTEEKNPEAKTKGTAEAKVENPVDAEYARVSKEIPRTEEAKSASFKKIEEAYFNLGDIYYFKLQESENAITAYATLLKRFPETEHEPEVLYKLYLIHKESDPVKADAFAADLHRKYPASTFSKILLNPDYLKESSETAERQKLLYKTAYAHFSSGDYSAAKQISTEALQMGETTFTPNLELLNILIIGETENITKYQYELDQFIKKYTEGDLVTYAKNLLSVSRDHQIQKEKGQGIAYVRSLEEPHYFVMIYKTAEKLSESASASLEKLNQQEFKDWKLKTSNLVLSDDYTLTLVAELPTLSTANQYQKTFTEKLGTLTELRNRKFNTFVITKDNFDIFYRTKGLDEYIQFFEKNYPTKNQ